MCRLDHNNFNREKENTGMGTVRYEANPPKVETGTDINEAVSKSTARLLAIAPNCDSIHITENVLGFERVSPIVMGRIVRKEIPGMPVTVSLRVRDKTESEIFTFADRCIDAGFDGMLILMGDPPRNGRADTGQIPSAVMKSFRERGINSKIKLYMSISNRPSKRQIQKKIEAHPDGFFTQVVQDAEQVKSLAERLEGFKVVPIILHPSPKNRKSAEFLKLDLDSYAGRFGQFVRDISRITGDVLITSPNDFAAADRFFAGLNG